MYGNVIGFVAFYFVLRMVRGAVVGIAFPLEVTRMDLADRAADVAGFRVPADVIANFEFDAHGSLCF